MIRYAKSTWKNIFSEFRETYPELWCYGTTYEPYNVDRIKIRNPKKGVFIYDYNDDSIEWVTKYGPSQKELDKNYRYGYHDYFCDCVEKYMKDHNMTHQEFGKKVGISRRSLSKYLNEHATPKMSTMRRILKCINIEI